VLGVVEEAQPVADEPSSLESEEKTLDRQIRAFHWVRLLAELPGRAAGSALEREAAERVEAWMREIGFDEVERSPVPSRPSPGAVLALHLGLGALGCWIGGIPGLLLAGLALLSFQREQRRGVRGLSSLLGARDSLNVAARAGVARPRRRIVLTAHIDATRAGRIFSRRFVGPSACCGPRG
jgi:acetylornithine deacetylase/succinyl-diaminopimelate desuccinylase-like protein